MNLAQLGIKTRSDHRYVCHLYAGHGWGGCKEEWFYSWIIAWSRRAEQTAGRGAVMRLPEVQVYNESFFMPDLCRERQARKAIRERQLSAISSLQRYRISVCSYFTSLSQLVLSITHFLHSFFSVFLVGLAWADLWRTDLGVVHNLHLDLCIWQDICGPACEKYFCVRDFYCFLH